MIRVFIADDEEPARERLKELLSDIGEEVPNMVAGEAKNGIDALERLPASGAQVLLLDIRMPGMDGLELARHLTGLEQAPAVGFITAHDKHALEAFELNPLDYLLKPVRAPRPRFPAEAGARLPPRAGAQETRERWRPAPRPAGALRRRTARVPLGRGA